MVFERTIEIMSKIEEILEKENITIPSDERENNEDEARLFGTQYYEIESFIEEEINKNSYPNNYSFVLKGLEELHKENDFSLELIKQKLIPLIHIKKIIEYFSDELSHFAENCQCGEEIQDKLNETGNVNLCKCEDNEDHILRSVVYLETLL